MSQSPRTIESRHILKEEDQVVDIRPQGEIFAEWLSDPINFLKVVPGIVLACVLFPVLLPLGGPAFLILTLMFINTHHVLPLRYPVGTKDNKGKPGKGILYVGEVASRSEYENMKELWLTDDDMRKHMLILGSTGSGKSEALKSIFFNALNWSSGFFIADGKADNKLPTDVYTMCRSNGRDPDLLILNFLLAGKTPEQVRLSRRRRTNKLNPFTTADADTIIQMGANLLPKVDGDAKNWQEKALNLWRSVVQAVCYKRDTTGFEISVSTFLDYMALQKVEELYIEGYREAQTRDGEWSYGFAGVKNYLDSGCPAYQVEKLLKKHKLLDVEDAGQARKAPFGSAAKNSGKEFEQENAAYEQHAYRTNQLMPVLNLLDKTYGFIFRDKYPEIDMTDVTLRNRVMVMLIPSLEKSASEAENLGKLAIACLRVMMGKNLGSEVEGDHDDLIETKATKSPYPYVVALDELAYYFSDGIAVMFAQARSLGTSMIAAAQDIEKLTEGSRASEAGAMLANTTIKFFMRIDDAGKTADMIQKIVGKINVAMKRSYDVGFMRTYGRRSEVEIQQVDVLPTRKMQEFGQGEGVVNAMGKTTYMRWFYMGKDIEKHRVKRYWINRFLQVAPPTQEQLIANSSPMEDVADPYEKGRALLRKMRGEEAVEMYIPPSPVIEAVARTAAVLNQHQDAFERGISLYMAAREAILAAQEVQMDISTPAAAEANRVMGRPGQPMGGPQNVAGQGLLPSNELDDYVTPDAVNAQASQLQEAQDQSLDTLSFMDFDTPFTRKPSKDIISMERAASTLGKRQEAIIPGPSMPPMPGEEDREMQATMEAIGSSVSAMTSFFGNQVRFKPTRSVRVKNAGAEDVLLSDHPELRQQLGIGGMLSAATSAATTAVVAAGVGGMAGATTGSGAAGAGQPRQVESPLNISTFDDLAALQENASLEDDWVSTGLERSMVNIEARGFSSSEGGGADAAANMSDLEGMMGLATDSHVMEPTVVGLNDVTLTGLTKVEQLMNHPEPRNAALTFERAISGKVTPQNEATLPAAGDGEIDKLFADWSHRLETKS